MASQSSALHYRKHVLIVAHRTLRPSRIVSPKISTARVFDLTRRCSDKQCVHLPKAIEMADRDSARRGSPDSLIGGRNRLSSGITGNTTNCGRFRVIGVYFVNDPPISPDPDLSVSPPERVPAAAFAAP